MGEEILIISQSERDTKFYLLSDFKAASAVVKYMNIHIYKRMNTAGTLLLEHYENTEIIVFLYSLNIVSMR